MMKIGFSRPKKFNPLSWAIMKFLGTTYSHTFLMFDVESTGQEVVYHANHKGVNCLNFPRFSEKNEIIEWVEITDEKKRSKALHFCIEKLGLPYSTLTIISVYFNLKFGDGTRAFICSELVARALGVKVENLDKIDPKKLKEILNAENKV